MRHVARGQSLAERFVSADLAVLVNGHARCRVREGELFLTQPLLHVRTDRAIGQLTQLIARRPPKARKLKVEYPVMTRGDRREPIFHEDMGSRSYVRSLLWRARRQEKQSGQ